MRTPVFGQPGIQDCARPLSGSGPAPSVRITAGTVFRTAVSGARPGKPVLRLLRHRVAGGRVTGEPPGQSLPRISYADGQDLFSRHT